ncbi:MAG: H-type lectin domain-containing protein [Pseudomonadota bacterium]
MKYIVNQSIGIAQGEDTLFSDYEDGGDMWTGQGPRERRKTIVFQEPFKAPPSVQVSLSMWDMHSANNARADVSADAINATGFDVVFKTWGDTRIARARVSWMAIGPVTHEDDWELY